MTQEVEVVPTTINVVPQTLQFSPTARIDSLREAYLRGMGGNYRFGRVVHNNHMTDGDTAVDWIKRATIVKSLSEKEKKNLTPSELDAFSTEIAAQFAVIAGMHAYYSAMQSNLEGAIEEQKATFVSEEVQKYAPGGEHWNTAIAKSAVKKPSGETLEKMADAAVAEPRSLLRYIKMETMFFGLLLSSLEEQRRCLKEQMTLRTAEIRRFD